MTRGRLFIWSFMAAALALAGCDSDRRAISLDEARQATAQLRFGRDLRDDEQPPAPKRAADVLAVLARPGPSNERIQLDTRRANARPPAEADHASLANFYYQRSLVAARLGRDFQQVADMRKAVEALGAKRGNADAERESRLALPRPYLERWAYSERSVGNQRVARDLLVELVGAYERGNSVDARMLLFYRDIAMASANLGEFDQAEIALRKGDALRQHRIDRYYDTPYKYEWEAILLSGRAAVARRQNRLADAEDALRRSIHLYERMDELKQQQPEKIKGDWRASLADCYQDLTYVLRDEGRLAEAEAASLTALDFELALYGRNHYLTARVLTTWAGILFYQKRRADRERVLRAVVQIYQALGHDERSVTLADTLAWHASALLMVGRADEGMAEFERARATYAAVSPARLDSHLGIESYAIALLTRGRTDEAVEVSRRRLAAGEKAFGPDGMETQFARAQLGAILAESGHDEEAVALFRRAMPAIFSRDEGTGDEETGERIYDTQRQGYTFTYFAALARLHGRGWSAPGFDPAQEAFELSERERYSGVDRALLAASVRNAAADPHLADMIREEQNARVEYSRLSRQLALMQAAPPGQRNVNEIAGTKRRIERIDAAHAVLARALAEGAPEYGRLQQADHVTLAAARQALRDDEAMVVVQSLFHSGYSHHRLFVWAFRRTGPVAFQYVELPMGKLAADMKTLRRGLEPDTTTLAEMPEFEVALAHDLYARFLEPVAAGWQGAHTLVVVTPGMRNEVPFHLMVTKPVQLAKQDTRLPFDRYAHVPWLAREVAIAQLPSVSALVLLRGTPRPVQPSEPFIGFGDPWFNQHEAVQAEADFSSTRRSFRSGRLSLRAVRKGEDGQPLERIELRSRVLGALARLPETADEIRTVAATLGAPDADVKLGAAANERAVRSMDLSQKRVVMFATHGLIPGDLPGLTQPALALSAPEIAGVPGDGLLTVDKILDLKLNADWVVLSACNTGNAGPGGDGISGLGRAFFYAGARALLVTNWAVETTSAQKLTTETFRLESAHPELSRAEAFRQSMLNLIDGPGYRDEAGRPIFSYAHPLFWAPYSLIGDPG